ncbi:MAG: hypothetical protein ACPIA7_05590 [Akkermansiaceae bacterium]
MPLFKSDSFSGGIFDFGAFIIAFYELDETIFLIIADAGILHVFIRNPATASEDDPE